MILLKTMFTIMIVIKYYDDDDDNDKGERVRLASIDMGGTRYQ